MCLADPPSLYLKRYAQMWRGFFFRIRMKNTKTPLSFEDQAKLLIKRGLIVEGEVELVNYLSNVNYYRLSGYLYPFKRIDPTTNEESFVPNTNFSTIKKRYEFDRKLRLLLMDAIE